MKSFEDTKTEITEFLESPNLAMLMEHHSQSFSNQIRNILKDIETMIEEPEDQDTERLCGIAELSMLTDTLMKTLLENATSDQMLDDLKNVCHLIYNYNDNTQKDNSIRTKCIFIINFIDGFVSLREAIQIIRNLKTSTEQLTKFNPPSFGLSKHYIDSIYGKDQCEE